LTRTSGSIVHVRSWTIYWKPKRPSKRLIEVSMGERTFELVRHTHKQTSMLFGICPQWERELIDRSNHSRSTTLGMRHREDWSQLTSIPRRTSFESDIWSMSITRNHENRLFKQSTRSWLLLLTWRNHSHAWTFVITMTIIAAFLACRCWSAYGYVRDYVLQIRLLYCTKDTTLSWRTHGVKPVHHL